MSGQLLLFLMDNFSKHKFEFLSAQLFSFRNTSPTKNFFNFFSAQHRRVFRVLENIESNDISHTQIEGHEKMNS